MYLSSQRENGLDQARLTFAFITSLTFKFPGPATIEYQKNHQNEQHALHLVIFLPCERKIEKSINHSTGV